MPLAPKRARMRRFGFTAVFSLVLVMLAVASVPASAGEAVLYQGESGFNKSFPLKGGVYSLYVHASFSRTYRTHSPDSCVFSSNLQRVSPTRDSVQLGGAAPITATGPYSLGPVPVTLPAGTYVYYVASQVDCLWHFSLEPAGRQTTGIGTLQTFTVADGGALHPAAAFSIGEKIQFSVPFGVGTDASTAPTGELQLIHGGQVVERHPLQAVMDEATKSPVLAITLQFEPSDAKYAGKNTAKVVVKIGAKQFTSSKEFTLTP